MNEPEYPIVTREEISDGYIMRYDYGPKQGVTTCIIKRRRASEDERAQMHRGINAIVSSYGYTLAD